MFLRKRKSQGRSAAWRIAIWPTVAFALGSAVAFAIMYLLIARDIRERSDAWLSGEAEVLADVSENTPRDALYDRLVQEVAELASREVPDTSDAYGKHQSSVFFRSEEHTSERQSLRHLVCRLLLKKKKNAAPKSSTADIHRLHSEMRALGTGH